MHKENGKFVIDLGGVKTIYDNFGDFVLQEMLSILIKVEMNNVDILIILIKLILFI